MPDDLLVIAAGGTYDKCYEVGRDVDDFSYGATTALVDVLRRARSNLVFECVSRNRKDSLHMTNDDREAIVHECQKHAGSSILVIHGTDTMIATASRVAHVVKDKTIVFTGASQPAGMRETDADFNTGFGIAAALYAPPGVYIAMGGQVFQWHDCQKREDGSFSTL